MGVDYKALIDAEVAKRGQDFIKRLAWNLRLPVASRDSCIEYDAGHRPQNGYCQINFWVDGKTIKVYAHRLFWVIFNGRNPGPKMEIDHTCGNRKCVNDWHLREVTPAQNKLYRTRSNGRQKEVN